MFAFKLFIFSLILLTYTSEGRVCRDLQQQDDRIKIKFGGEEGENIKHEIVECAKDLVDIDDFLQVLREGEYRTDEAFQKVVYCSYKNTGYGNDDGTIKIEEGSRLFPDPDRIYKVMKMCNQKYETPVKTTNEFFKCFQDNTPFFIDVSID